MAKTFQDRHELIAWLLNDSVGRQVMTEACEREGRNRTILAVQHADHVDLYCRPKMRLVAVTQIHGSTPESELMAEKILESDMALSSRMLFEPGNRIGCVRNHKLTVPEYEWWTAFQQNIKDSKSRIDS